MLKRLANSILLAVMGAAALFAVEAAISRVTSPKGDVVIGSLVSVDDQSYVPIEITNRSDQSIEGLRLHVPIGMVPEGIRCSVPCQISALTGSQRGGGVSLLELGALDPETRTRLLVPVASRDVAALVQVRNADEKGLSLHSDAVITSRGSGIIVEALVYAGIMLVLLFCLGFYVFGQTESLQQKLARAVAEAREIERGAYEKLEKTESELESVRKVQARMKAMLIRENAQLHAELRFWRDTIRQVLRSSAKEPATSSEDLLKSISATLKTYSTHGSPALDPIEYEALLETLAQQLEDQGDRI